MAKILLAVLALCFVSISTAHFASRSYMLQGRVYCDTCRCGFETPATKYLHGYHLSLSLSKLFCLVYLHFARSGNIIICGLMLREPHLRSTVDLWFYARMSVIPCSHSRSSFKNVALIEYKYRFNLCRIEKLNWSINLWNPNFLPQNNWI